MSFSNYPLYFPPIYQVSCFPSSSSQFPNFIPPPCHLASPTNSPGQMPSVASTLWRVMSICQTFISTLTSLLHSVLLPTFLETFLLSRNLRSKYILSWVSIALFLFCSTSVCFVFLLLFCLTLNVPVSQAPLLHWSYYRDCLPHSFVSREQNLLKWKEGSAGRIQQISKNSSSRVRIGQNTYPPSLCVSMAYGRKGKDRSGWLDTSIYRLKFKSGQDH